MKSPNKNETNMIIDGKKEMGLEQNNVTDENDKSDK